MTVPPLDHWLDRVTSIARRAGDAILKVHDQGLHVTHKADSSPLTSADTAAHALIVNELSRLNPKLPILSEESDPKTHEDRHHWDAFWLVDPLDGTKEFLKGNGEFTVNIALIVDHEVKLGVVHAPALDTLYSAADGVHCRQFHHGMARDLRVKPLSTAPIRAVGSRSHTSPAVQTYLDALPPHTLISMGSSLKFCLVAEGTADIYPRFGPTSEWDTAAAQCIVEQAGGKVIDLQGHPLRYNKNNSLRNPHFLAVADREYDWLAPLKSHV